MQARLPLLAISLFALSACGGNKVRGDGPPSGSSRIPDMRGEVTPRPEKRSRYGNGPVYEVFGKRYTVMPSSSGYQERGVASWYGKKFHGNLTSNREPYDMYAMTAAHKTLPLPTYVRVRNLRNDKSIIVRVNDRGPFVHNRIIDLSYAAAIKLDMIKDGTSLVEVTAISFDPPAGDRPVRRPVGGPSGPVAAEAAPTGAEAAPTGTEAAPQGLKPLPQGLKPRPQRLKPLPGNRPTTRYMSRSVPLAIDQMPSGGSVHCRWPVSRMPLFTRNAQRTACSTGSESDP